MDTSPEKDSTTVNDNNDYELKLEEEDPPMVSNEAEESTSSPVSPPPGDGQLISVDLIMTSDEEDDSPLNLDATMVPAAEEEDDDSPPSPAAEDDDQLPLKRRSAATGDNGSSTITSGESGSWDSELDTGFQNAPNGVNIESNCVDEYEEDEVTLPQKQAEEEYEISRQQAEDDYDISMQQAEEEYEVTMQQAEKAVVTAEQGNGAVQSYSKSEEKRAEGVAGTSSEIEWSGFDVNRDYLASRFKNVDIDALMRAAFRDKQIQGKQIEYREGTSVEEIGLRDGETVIYEAEESDEEVVELEFEAAVEKIHKHEDYGMYCPNCSNQITRVVLRRKIKQRRVLVASGRDRRDLFGCLSCFSIFIPSGNKLNPFKIFGGKRGRDETTQLQEEQLPTSAAAVPSSDAPVPSLGSAVPTTDSTQVDERKFDCFWFLKKRRVDDQSESDLTSPLLQDSSSATTVAREETQQTSTTTVTSESIEQGGGVQTSTTTVTSKSKDVSISQGGEVQTSTTTVTSESRDTKQGGEVQSSKTSTTTVTSESWDETTKPGGALQSSTTTVKPAHGGNIQLPQEQPASDGTTVVETDTKQVKAKGFDVFWFLKRGRADESDLRTPLIPAAAQIPSSFSAFSAAPGIMQTTTTTVTSRQPIDEPIKQEGYLQTSTRDETIDQQGKLQRSTRDEAFKQDGKSQTSTTTVTSKQGNEAFEQDGKFQTLSRDEVNKQGGYLQTSTRDEAIEQQRTFQTSTRDEAFKQEGPFQKSTTTTTTTVTSKPKDEAIKKEGMFQTSETTVVSWQSDEAIKQGYAVSQQEKDNKSSGIRVPGDYMETSVYDSVTTTESFQGENVGKPGRVATDTAAGEVPQTTGQQDSKQESVITTETIHVETMRKPEGVAISAAAVGSIPQIASQQDSIQDRNVIIDVYGKKGEVIHQAKPPVQPQLQIRGDGPSVGGDVRITVEETRVETQTVGSTDVAVSTTGTEIVTESRPSVWFDILKSIVYGGLMESVISLFVVSLAIASNATTMNVVAIGSAFVVGGFILLIHNLRVLRYGDSTQTSEQRYEVQLGKIDRFPLHAFVAVVSHVVFGLIPLVIFRFMFPGDMEFKMISVGVASFISIFILAISLAYVRGEQTFVAYFKTVLYYVFLAAIASAAAFGIAYLLQDPFPCPAALDL